MPRIEFSGVRSSWLIPARKSVFASEAASASRRASPSSRAGGAARPRCTRQRTRRVARDVALAQAVLRPETDGSKRDLLVRESRDDDDGSPIAASLSSVNVSIRCCPEGGDR